MPSGTNSPGKLAFSTQCVPGSAAELKEKERIEEFQRTKAARKADEARDKPEMDLERERVYQASSAANKARMTRNKSASSATRGTY